MFVTTNKPFDAFNVKHITYIVSKITNISHFYCEDILEEYPSLLFGESYVRK